MATVVVVGAGQAGFAVATQLRGLGYAGELVLIGSEAESPYERPPLSKGFLLDPERPVPALQDRACYADQAIELQLSSEVEAVDPVARTLTVGGVRRGYDALVLATGAAPRALPGAPEAMRGVHYLRSSDDARALRGRLQRGQRLVVIGGGYVGLEVAASARELGLQVTVVEAGERILQRVAGVATAELLRAEHRRRGVQILEGVGVDSLLGGGAVEAVQLADGRRLQADSVLVGIGAEPRTTLARVAGLAVDDGVLVDAFCRTSAPDVYAIGDCARFPFGDGSLRLESVPNASDMAACAAHAIVGSPVPYCPTPWFWSQQYDWTLQMAGFSAGADRVVRRQSGGGGVTHWYFRGDRLVALEALNDAKAYLVGKRLIEQSRSPDPALLADPKSNLKALLKA